VQRSRLAVQRSRLASHIKDLVLLVDTSVWIEIFRKPSRFQIGSVTDLDEVVTCLPIIQEVLQSFREEQAFRVAA
jgi:predicted nucleic acid-binding protein